VSGVGGAGEGLSRAVWGRSGGAGRRVRGSRRLSGHCPSLRPPRGRFCLGAHLAIAEAKVFLAVLAQRYTFQLTEPDTTEWVNRVGPVPTNGLPMVVRPLA
jgi:cytochrome P450